MEYPKYSPEILTDTLYTNFGGKNGESTAGQRSAAYLIAEERMSDHLNTFLLPTIITGTYPWPVNGDPICLDHAYVRSIKSVHVYTEECCCDCDLIANDGCALIIDGDYGYVYVKMTDGVGCGCGCGGDYGYPYNVQVVYEAGLYSGTSYAANMLTALTIVAQDTLNEMIEPGANEGAGDVQIQEFQNQSYREKRGPMLHTALGESPRANFAARLVRRLKRHKYLKL